MDLGHHRNISTASRRSSISSMSDDGAGVKRGSVRSWDPQAADQHVLSPPFPETPGSVSIASFNKRNASGGYEYERASLAELPPRPRKKVSTLPLPTLKKPKWLSWFRQKYWAYEIAGWLSALLLFIILVALLSRFDKRSYTDWHFDITLNAVSALIVSLFVLSLGQPVASCLGQLKWNRFRRHGGELRDFDRYDQASRTVWGSFKLIARRPTQFYGVLAAVITIVLQAVGPFVQQIISLSYQAQVPYTTGNVPVAYGYAEKGDTSSTVAQLTQFATYTSLFTLQPDTFPVQLSGMLAHSNGTFPNYATLGVRSECADITDTLTKTTIQLNDGHPEQFFKVSSIDVRLPNGHLLSSSIIPAGGQYQLHNFNISADNPSIAFKDRGNVIVDFTSIFVPPLKNDFVGDVKPIAWECMMQFTGLPLTCNTTETSNPSFDEWLTHDPVVNNTPEAQQANPWKPVTLNPKQSGGQTCVHVTVPTQPGKSQDISTCYTGQSKLANFLQGTFKGLVLSTADKDQIIRNDTFTQNAVAAGGNGMVSVVSSIASVVGGPPPTSFPNFNITAMINATANSLTNNIRTASDDAQRDIVNGTAATGELQYIIKWQWASVPALLIVLSAILIGATMIDTRRKNLPVWSTTCLADLIHGLDDQTRAQLMSITEVEQLEQASERINVFLRPQDKVLAALDSAPMSGTSIDLSRSGTGASRVPMNPYRSEQAYSQVPHA